MSDIRRALQDESEAARSLLASVRDIIADDEQAISDLVEGETKLIEAIGAAVDKLHEIEGFADGLKSKIDALRNRRDSLETSSEKIRAAILLAMTRADLTKVKLAQATLSRRAAGPSVTVISQAEIPSRFFVDQAPALNKRLLLDALKSGERIEGAELSNGGETLVVRT